MSAAKGILDRTDWIKQLPKVVVAHATFQKAVSGNPSEGALSYPIQSFLSIKCVSGTLEPEHDHPTLKGDSKLGRPWQIDFVAKDTRRKWAFALEVKIHDGNRWDRVVRDFIKLLLLGKHSDSKNAARYLLVLFPVPSKVASVSGNPDEVCLKQSISQGGASVNLFEAVLPWKSTERKFWLGELSAALQRSVWESLKAFGQKEVRGDVKVRLMSKDWSDDFACGLWRLDWRGPEKPFQLPYEPVPKSKDDTLPH